MIPNAKGNVTFTELLCGLCFPTLPHSGRSRQMSSFLACGGSAGLLDRIAAWLLACSLLPGLGQSFFGGNGGEAGLQNHFSVTSLQRPGWLARTPQANKCIKSEGWLADAFEKQARCGTRAAIAIIPRANIPSPLSTIHFIARLFTTWQKFPAFVSFFGNFHQ